MPAIGIEFTPSLVSKTNQAAESLETLKRYIYNQVDYQAALAHQIGFERKVDNRIVSLVDLREVFAKHLFHNKYGSGGSDEDQRLVSFKIAGGVLRVELERYRGYQKGTVWIRIADRTLIRAVENGFQVYPEANK